MCRAPQGQLAHTRSHDNLKYKANGECLLRATQFACDFGNSNVNAQMGTKEKAVGTGVQVPAE